MQYLEDQEKAKEAAKKKRQDKVLANMERMEKLVFSGERAKAKKEDDKIREYIRQKQLEDLIKDQEKQRDNERERAKVKEILKLQVKERQNAKSIDRDMMKEQAEYWRKDKEKYDKDEKAHDSAMKAKIMRNAEILQDQI